MDKIEANFLLSFLFPCLGYKKLSGDKSVTTAAVVRIDCRFNNLSFKKIIYSNSLQMKQSHAVKIFHEYEFDTLRPKSLQPQVLKSSIDDSSDLRVALVFEILYID